MKTLTRLSLVLLLLGSGQAQANSFYSAASALFAIGRHWNALAGPAISAKNFIDYKNQLPTLPDAPEVIVNLCHDKLKTQGLNHEQIQLKVKQDCGLIEAFSNTGIVFSPAAANEFASALENPIDEKSAGIIKTYSTLIDHEIAHLKNSDSFKRLAILTGASLAGYAASSYLVNVSRFSFLFEKPTNIKEFFICMLSYGLVNASTGGFANFLTTTWTRNQEIQADAYAMSQANDPEALRYAAKFFEMLDKNIIDFLCGDGQPHHSIPLIRQMQMQNIRAMLIAQYQAEQTQEEFRSWVQKQTQMLAWLKLSFDPEHPTGASRAQAMRAAADALEAAQKTTEQKLKTEIIPAA